MSRKDSTKAARAILDRPDGPLPIALVLRALRYKKGETRWFEGGIPSRLTLPPIVRAGDRIEVNVDGRVAPFVGCVAVVAQRRPIDGHDHPRVTAALVFEGPDGRLWCDPKEGAAFPLADARLVGVVTLHRTRLEGSRHGTSTRTREEGLPFFYTPAVYTCSRLTNDPDGVRL